VDKGALAPCPPLSRIGIADGGHAFALPTLRLNAIGTSVNDSNTQHMATRMTAIVRVDRNGIIGHWNTAAEHLFGFTELEAVGSPLELIIPQASHACHQHGFESYVSTGIKTLPETVTAVGRHKNGQLVSFQISTKAIFDNQGAVAGVEGLMLAD
jgi:PAS domain S-box-containing protein